MCNETKEWESYLGVPFIGRPGRPLRAQLLLITFSIFLPRPGLGMVLEQIYVIPHDTKSQKKLALCL